MLSQRGRKEQGSRLQRPILPVYIPPHPGHTICIDLYHVTFPVRIQRPFALLACAATRFIVVGSVANLRPETISNIMARRWILYFGRITRILLDMGAREARKRMVHLFRNSELSVGIFAGWGQT